MKLCIGTSSTKKNQNKSIRNGGFMKPGETCNRWLVALLAALCRSTQGQFPNFQIHLAEQSFCGSDRSEPVARLADLPSLLEKSVLSPPRQGLNHGESESEPVPRGKKSKNARTTRSPRNSDKPQVAALVPDWAAPARVPELLALAGKAQLRKAIRPARGTSPPSGLDPGVGVPADLSHKESDAW
jgi:hypothetical protein